MRRSLFFLLILIISSGILAQEKTPKKYLSYDFQLVVDNDVFTMDITKDQYYSSGIYPEVRMLIDSGENVKKIRSFRFNHRMYTPFWVGWRRVEELDRPYAGIMSLTAAQEYYFESNKYLKVGLELGWLGPGALIGEQQTTWHKWFGMPAPQGWKYQIANTPVINLSLNYLQPIYSSYRFEISSESDLSLGTVYNNARQSLLIRTGELKPLNKSAYTASYLGKKRGNRTPKTDEFYFFYSPGIEYVFHNATLEGGFIGPESPHTVEAISWVIQHRAGIMFSWPRFDLSFVKYWRSKENEEAMKHQYVAIRMNQRF